MGQLMRQQATPCPGPRLVSSVVEGNVVANSEGLGLNITACLHGIGAGVDTHTAEIVSHPRFEEISFTIGQGLPTAMHPADLSLDVRGSLEGFIAASGLNP